MKKVQIKVGRDLIWVDETDVILDNGSCIQIITQAKFNGWYTSPIKMSKTLFKQLKACAFIYTNNTININYNTKYYTHSSYCTYYKFNIDSMVRSNGYEVKED